MMGRDTLRVALALLIVEVAGCNLPTGNETGLLQESYLHIRASWSPDGRSISFTASMNNIQGIYLVDSSGMNVRLLIGGQGIGTTWSPDAAWLAFSSVGSIYKIKSSGDSLTRLTTSIGDIRPAWSPDGGKLCFLRRDQVGTQAVWIYDVRSGTLSQLVSFGDHPTWYPDSKTIMILETQFDEPANTFVYRFTSVDLETKSATTVNSLASKGDCGFTAMSPKGDAIVYSIKPTDDYAQIWKVDLGSGRHSRLTGDGGDYPAWSPDGNRIVYTRTQKGDGALWVMNADGTGKRRLTSP
jgi:Tol biopolymer transport system component